MKKSFPFLILFICAFISARISAQSCGALHPSGSSICTPNQSFTTVGFSPPYDSLPCVVTGVDYNQVIQFHTPSTVTQGSSTYTLNWVQIDTISNLPCGLCWASGDANNRINANSTGCIKVFGHTYDKPGQYKMHVIVDANVHVAPLVDITVTNQDAASLGLKYFARVKLPNGNCYPVDTDAVGNQAFHDTSTMNHPTITGPATLCNGASATLTASGRNYYAAWWSTGDSGLTAHITGPGTYKIYVLGACSIDSATKVVGTTNVSVTATANGPTTFCQGSSVTLDAGSGFTTYAWSNGGTTQTINVTTAGQYTVTATQSGGCQGTSNTITVTVNNPPSPTITPGGPTQFCSGGNVSLDAGAGYSAYSWSNGATTQSISATTAGSYTVTVTQNGCTGSSNPVSVTVVNPQPSITPSGPTTFCPGGSVTLDAGAGYSAYSWSNGASTQTINVTTAGSFTVTVTQSGCQGTSNPVTTSISSSLSPTITASSGLTICPGGSTTLDAGAGYASYSWSSGESTQTISPTSSGSYIVSVTQNACVGMDTVQVNFHALPSPNISPSGPVNACVGDQVILDAGAGYTSYAWSNGSTAQVTQPANSNTYTVTVTDAFACTGFASVGVTFNTPPHATISPSGMVSVCAGHSLLLNAGSGYTDYLWSNGAVTQTINVDTAGTYDVTVTQNGCSGGSTQPVTLTVNAAPSVSISSTQLGGTRYTLDATSNNATTYQWQNALSDTVNGPFTNVSTLQSDTFDCTQSFGYFRVIAFGPGGCSDTSAFVYAHLCTGISEISTLTGFSVHPNPATDVMHVHYELSSTTPVHISVMDVTGRKVMDVLNENSGVGEHLKEVNLQSLAQGMYMLNFATDKGSFTTKFIKQ